MDIKLDKLNLSAKLETQKQDSTFFQAGRLAFFGAAVATNT